LATAVIRSASVYDLPVVVTERRAQVRGERTPRGGLVHHEITLFKQHRPCHQKCLARLRYRLMAWARTSFRSGAEKARQIPKRPPAVAPELSFESFDADYQVIVLKDPASDGTISST